MNLSNSRWPSRKMPRKLKHQRKSQAKAPPLMLPDTRHTRMVTQELRKPRDLEELLPNPSKTSSIERSQSLRSKPSSPFSKPPLMV